MSSKLKIIIYISLPLLLLIIIVATFYFLSGTSRQQDIQEDTSGQEQYLEANKIIFESGTDTTDTTSDNGQNNDTESAQDEEDINNRISDINIDQAQLIDNFIYFYSKEEKVYGRINIANGENKPEVLVGNLPVLSETIISTDQNKLLYKDFNKNSYFVYNFNTKETTELNGNISTALWHPTEDNKIIGTYSSSNINNINIYGVEDNSREEIINLFINNGILLDVTQDGKSLLFTRDESELIEESEAAFEEVDPDPATESFFVLFDIEGKKVISQREDVDRGKFSTDGKSILISKQSSSSYPRLSILNIESSNESPLNLSSYLEKVEFVNGNTLAYAKVESHEGPFFRDTLWLHDIDSGRDSRLTRLEDGVVHDVSNIMASSDGQNIYFLNRYDKKIYVVNTST